MRLLIYRLIAKNGSKRFKNDKWTGQGQVKNDKYTVQHKVQNVNSIHSEKYSHFKSKQKKKATTNHLKLDD
ncbi:protein of unknown function [Ruminococcaceae bacterium BL-4]|nr:protein of unknown function [Ruminococcaceae bacterium BL-4]